MEKRQKALRTSFAPMAERVAAFDWAATSLGPSHVWSEGLRTSVRTVLDRPFPEALLWGPEFVFCAYNDAYRPLLASRPEALGRRFFDVWAEFRDTVEPLLEDARRGAGSRFEEAGFALSRGGAVEQTWFDFSFSPVRDAHGAVVAVLVFAAEATQRVLARTELQASMERLRLAAEATGFASYDFDVERRESLWSNEIRSITRCENEGPTVPQERVFERIHPEDRDRFERFVASTLGAPGPCRQEIELRIVRPDGKVRWVRDSNQVLFEEVDGTSRPVRVVGTLQDITERREAEEALRESDRAKGEFLAILGHELRNPLAPIRTALDVLQQRSAGADTSDPLIPMMDRQLSHLTRLVDDLLGLSRIERGEIEVHRAPLRLGEVVDAAVEQTRSLVDEREHELTVRMTTPDLLVDGDFERLTQVVANLLRNAAKYTEPGGRIDVGIAREAADVVVRVRDTGYGIPADRLENIFAMFQQIPEHKRRVEGGLGVGLALSRQLVAMHDGSIEAFSDGLGKGSEFVVRLPPGADATAGAVPPIADPLRTQELPSGPVASVPTPARRVLIVDDNVDAAEGLRRLLTLKGHTVATAYDGQGALRTLERVDPEVVLLDLGLPEMDGFEVAWRIRATAKGATMRIIALTGWGQEEDKARTKASGFDAHLTKPIKAGEILSLLGTDERA